MSSNRRSFEEVERICGILVLKTSLMRKFKGMNLLDRTPMLYIHIGWMPEPRYRPIEISWIVAYSLRKKSTFDQTIHEAKQAAKKLKNEKRRLDATGKKMRDLKIKNILNELLENHAQQFSDAFDKKSNADFKRANLIKCTTRPHLMYFDFFCKDLVKFFKKRTGKPNYASVAKISNIFNLTSIPQSASSIRQRCQRLK